MAQKDVIFRCGEDGILREAGQEGNLLLTIPRIQVFFMQPVFVLGPGRAYRNLADGMQIVVAWDNYFTLPSNQIQAGRSIPAFGVAIIGFTEPGDIAKAYEKVIALLVDLVQNFFQAVQVLMNI